jgi:glycerol-3-phosphate dehydrogenase
VREHYIEQSKSNLISIAGGKWTSYRKMAEDTVDLAQKLSGDTKLHDCCTKNYKLLGSRIKTEQIKDKLDKLGLEKDLSEHLIKTYGSQSLVVVDFIQKYSKEKIHKDYPVLKAEIHYGVEHEFVKNPLDFLVRRVGLGLIDLNATKASLQEVTLVLKEHFGWSDEIFENKFQEASYLLDNDI